MPENKAAEKAPKAKAPKAKTPKETSDAAPATQVATKAASAVVSARGTCTVEKCGLPLRAKGYCRKHFMSWRRGKLGTHHQYKICTKEACRKQRQYGSLCAEHAGKAAPAESAAAS
jgi:hypothetical protein